MKQHTTKLNADHLLPNDAALLCCQATLDLKNAGKLPEALKTIQPFWKDIAELPNIDGLHLAVAAELFLTAGSLLAAINTSDKNKVNQPAARSLINQSLSYYQSVNDQQKLAAAQIELAYSYKYETNFSQAQILFKEAIQKITADGKTKANALLGLVEVEFATTNYEEAFTLLNSNNALFSKLTDHSLKTKYHYQLATVLTQRARAINQTGLLAEALVEYQQADAHLKSAKNPTLRIDCKITLAHVLRELKRYKEAHRFLAEAYRLAASKRDRIRVATIYQAQAQLLATESQYRKAEPIAARAATIFIKAKENAKASEALIIHATILVRLQKLQPARHVMENALRIAQRASLPIEAGLTLLTMIEELPLSPPELQAAFINSRQHLANYLCEKTLLRLLKAADKVLLSTTTTLTTKETTELLLPKPKGFKAAVLAYEHEMILDALTKSNGRPTVAARLLEMSYQALAYIIENRHADLLVERTPIKRRETKHLPPQPQSAAVQPQPGN